MSDRAIGKRGGLPWGKKFAFDRHRFAAITMGHVVVMGRKTWESLPSKPLEGRLNVVVTSRGSGFEATGCLVCSTLEAAVSKFSGEGKRLFLIGGAELYNKAFELGFVRKVYRTVIHDSYPDCDAFFPKVDYPVVSCVKFDLTLDDNTQVSFFEEDVAPHPEREYLNIVSDIIQRGMPCSDRTGTGTFRLFGRSMRFSLENNKLPLLTSKCVSWSSVANELLWFISGSTDNNALLNKGVAIWSENARDHKAKNLDIAEGDLGPTYGFQWRHFGAEYKSCDTHHGGVDQIANLIKGLKKDPLSRRHILSAWNPAQIDQMALPPCHVLCQFLVDAESNLTCILYQRSGDMGLGVPFNIASYSLLTHLIAHCCNLKARELVHHLGDAHVYKNHVLALSEQLNNQLYPFPFLDIHCEPKALDDYEMQDFSVRNYRFTKLGHKMVMSL